MNLPKGMTTEEASLVKVAGHINEHDYATLIGGNVLTTDQTGKTDVVDSQQRRHSVKAGKKWQMFLYGESRLSSNTIFQTLGKGEIAAYMIECIASQPENREDREADKYSAKTALQNPMKALRYALDDTVMLRAFFLKATLEAGEVRFLAVLPSEIDQRTASLEEKKFHVFDGKEAVDEICKRITVVNSKARNQTQTDNQKVVFRTTHTIGEIEVRTDPHNYRKIKMWLDGKRTLDLLCEAIPIERDVKSKIFLHGKAKRVKVV